MSTSASFPTAQDSQVSMSSHIFVLANITILQLISKVKILSVFVNNAENVDNLIKWSSKNVEQLTIRCGSVPDHVQKIADNFRNLVHLEADIKIENFIQVIKLRNIQSIKARSCSLEKSNMATFEQFLSANGGKLKCLWIEECKDDVIDRVMVSLSANCPNLICFKIKNGIKLKEIDFEVIEWFPQLEKINLSMLGLLQSAYGVDKVEELLLRCKNSIKKVSLSNKGVKRFVECADLLTWPEDVRDTILMEQLVEIIEILCDHKRTGGNYAHNGKSLSRIEVNGKKWNGSRIVNPYTDKISFYY